LKARIFRRWACLPSQIRPIYKWEEVPSVSY